MPTKQRLEAEATAAAAVWSESFDTGYTKYCPKCCVRWDAKKELINQERFLTAAVCDSCMYPSSKLKLTNTVVDDDDDEDDDDD